MSEPDEELHSPCSGVCMLDVARGWCAGCFRKPAEIRVWPEASDEAKRAILAALDAREAQVEAEERGRGPARGPEAGPEDE